MAVGQTAASELFSDKNVLFKFTPLPNCYGTGKSPKALIWGQGKPRLRSFPLTLYPPPGGTKQVGFIWRLAHDK